MTPLAQLDAEILDNRAVAREHYLLSLAAPAIAVTARPGQFAMLRVTSEAAPLLPRAFSFYAVDAGAGRIDLLYRVVGAGTRLMSEMRPGERAEVWGPLGAGFTPAPSGRHLLVAGGVGVPPIVFLGTVMVGDLSGVGRRVLGVGGTEGAACARSRPPDTRHPTPDTRGDPPIQAFVGAATAEYLVGIDDLSRVGIRPAVATDDGSLGHRGFVTDLLREALARVAEPVTVYACGPMPMLVAVARICAESGAACQVALEAPMACGVGACLGCTVPRAAGGYARVCTDGPVFAAEEIEWSAVA